MGEAAEIGSGKASLVCAPMAASVKGWSNADSYDLWAVAREEEGLSSGGKVSVLTSSSPVGSSSSKSRQLEGSWSIDVGGGGKVTGVLTGDKGGGQGLTDEQKQVVGAIEQVVRAAVKQAATASGGKAQQ